MNKMTRRSFVKTSMAAVGGVATAPKAWAEIRGANEDIRLAIVGVRKKGIEHLAAFRKVPGVRIVALCDADTQFLDLEKKHFTDRNETVKTYIDYRHLMEDRDVDAVVLSVPDHWHGVMTVWACQAGKDVYVEKPACHSIWEGRKMIEAARKYNRLVGVGSQERSDVGLLAVADYLREGHLGPVRYARAISYGLRESIGKVNGPQPIPTTCDYDLFQGPAPLTPLMREKLHYDWHWIWSTGTGEMGNLGGHVVDDCRWMNDITTTARGAISIGGRFGYDDDGETPNTQITYYDFEQFPILYEIRGLPRSKGNRATDRHRGVRFGLIIQCQEGYFAGGRSGGWVYDNDGKKIKQFPGDSGGGHQANFIAAMRSRKVSDLNADILEGHLSATLCHMGNISYRLGHRKPVKAIQKAIAANELLSDAFDRCLDHLKANEIDLGKVSMTIGPMLSFDRERERFTGQDSEYANMFLKRNYRAPFVIPETV